jgi:hypothetical protein
LRRSCGAAPQARKDSRQEPHRSRRVEWPSAGWACPQPPTPSPHSADRPRSSAKGRGLPFRDRHCPQGMYDITIIACSHTVRPAGPEFATAAPSILRRLFAKLRLAEDSAASHSTEPVSVPTAPPRSALTEPQLSLRSGPPAESKSVPTTAPSSIPSEADNNPDDIEALLKSAIEKRCRGQSIFSSSERVSQKI